MQIVGAALTRFARLNNVALEELAAANGRTGAEDAVLIALLHADEVMKPSEIRKVIVQSPAGLTKTLRRLEDADLVRRRTDPGDRRALLVVLTAKGRRAAEQALREAGTYYDDLLGALTPADRADVVRLLRPLLDQLEGAAGVTSTHDTLTAASATKATR